MSLAHGVLGELKGVCKTIPNEEVLLNLLPIQESQFSSEIENILSTTDEIYISRVENNINSNTREIRNYEKALIEGFRKVKDKEILTNNMICETNKILLNNDAGFRKQAGTVLKNQFGRTIYTPTTRQKRNRRFNG